MRTPLSTTRTWPSLRTSGAPSSAKFDGVSACRRVSPPELMDTRLKPKAAAIGARSRRRRFTAYGRRHPHDQSRLNPPVGQLPVIENPGFARPPQCCAQELNREITGRAEGKPYLAA